ncbi:MAG: single-stranded DNA-binding protein [Gemmatimonadota bacterium]|nr:single-stranded DNA-binding protein [Gemmatimonadota bacterium]
MPTLRMPNINQVAVSGTLCQDPDFRFMDDGVARCRARVAVNRSYRDRNQEWQEETSYFDVVLWNKSAEVLAKQLTKGTPVFITGRLQSHSFRDAHDQPQTRVVIQVRNLQVLENEDVNQQEEELCQP